MKTIDANPKLDSSGVIAANALASLPTNTPVVGTGSTGLPVAAETTGTAGGKVVLDAGATVTGMTVNELTPAKITNLSATLLLDQVACPAFTAGAAPLAMGTAKASECVIESTRALTQASALTLATANAEAGFYYVTCRALTLGYVLTLVNGGAGGGNLTTFAVSLTKPRTACLYFDGTNFFYEGIVWVKP